MSNERVKAVVRGAVQGVGFRPFVYKLSTELGLRGWVLNSAQGVLIEVEGPRPELQQFLLRLEKEKPPRAVIQSLEFSFLHEAGYTGFEIRESSGHGGKTAFILPDIAVCRDCLADIEETGNRRHLYPFTNCTNCGPRFTIINSLPYDRANTSMKQFVMCADCEQEYHDPANRRFHAQPNACPNCGPQLALWDEVGKVLAERHDALRRAAAIIRDGQILAFKGVGGFQLMVDARNEESVRRLRERKNREEKPFALMYPSLNDARADCQVNDLEARLLAAPESPIVLLQRRDGTGTLAPSIAPGNPNLGVVLPSSPLHHLLMRELGFPIVATSGNLSHEPICIDETEALTRLGGIANVFLVHNRPIVRPVDDSVARIVLDRQMLLRRARGYAPLPVHVNQDLPAILAVGPHLKNTIALGIGREVFISQHVGDLETSEAWSTFRRAAGDLQHLYEFRPDLVACDLHGEYLSTKFARALGPPVQAVQHHYAHVLSCMAENELQGPVLGVAWDGTGLGPDGTIWGGEFLLVDDSRERSSAEAAYVRFAHLRSFPLPGGEAAVKQPRRAALGLLWEIFGEQLFERENTLPLRRQFSREELTMIRQMLANHVNAPVTSSAGRLFDAVAALLGLRPRSTYEGQAAMELEFAAEPGVDTRFFFKLTERREVIVDWQPMILRLLDGLARGEAVGRLAAAFHNTMAEIIVAVAKSISVEQVALTGGCFQNRYLLERAVRRLREEQFRPCWHQRVPPNDGGIALGQVIGAARAAGVCLETKEECFA
jgi:hydrogenase maturation protein HypF